MRPFLRLLPAALLITGACASAGAPPQPRAEPGAKELPLDVHWVRNSAEYRALTMQIYRAASDRVRALADTLERGGWAVILDADETVLDNSEYQRRITLAGQSFSNDTWNAWVREAAAPPTPGATGFIALVRSLGGRIAIVTNRDEEVCPPTRRNLERLGIVVDVVLCRQPGPSDKNPRFAAVREGSASADLPPLRVVLWVGDNIQDFPGLTQELRNAPEDAFAEFGRTWFVIPNPMYGSFESNPHR